MKRNRYISTRSIETDSLGQEMNQSYLFPGWQRLPQRIEAGQDLLDLRRIDRAGPEGSQFLPDLLRSIVRRFDSRPDVRQSRKMTDNLRIGRHRLQAGMIVPNLPGKTSLFVTQPLTIQFTTIPSGSLIPSSLLFALYLLDNTRRQSDLHRA